MSQPQRNQDEAPAAGDEVTEKGLKIVVPATQSLAKSDKLSPKDETNSKEDAEVTNYASGDIFMGMELKSIEEPAKSTAPDDAAGAKGPNIDVVYVTGAFLSQKQPLAFSDVVPMIDGGLEKRGFHFRVSADKLLNDDVEFTRINVEAEAHRLISALKHFQHSDAEVSRRAIIFIAYDIGAMVVQKAISVISEERMGEPGVLTDIVRVVSCGCFQRAENDENMGLKVFKFLDLHKDLNQMLLDYLTLQAAQNLARVLREVITSFLESKFAVRSDLISLHAARTGSQIHETFDYFTATLGLATEITIEEEYSEAQGSIFPLLPNKLLPDVESLTFDRWQLALESTLMSMVPQPVQMLSKSFSPAHPIFSSEAYNTWISPSGTRILLISGPDQGANVEAAEQVGLNWVKRHLSNTGDVFSFTFDAQNPSRKSIASMVTASMMQYSGSGSYESGYNSVVFLLKDQLKLQNAWLQEDIINLASAMSLFESRETANLLFGLDECDEDDRRAFWGLLERTASTCEEPAKFVVTTNKPGPWLSVFQYELGERSNISLLEFTINSNEDPKSDAPCEDDNGEYWIGRLCPKGMGQPQLSEALQRLRSMDRRILNEVLNLLETYSRWPATPSTANLALFCSLLQKVSPESTAASTLESILQSLPDQNWLQWLLRWTCFSQRPLTLSELSMLLCYCTQLQKTGSFCLLDDEDLDRSLHRIHHQMRGFLDINEGNIHISGPILEILEKSQSGVWKMAKETAPERTANFLLEFLGSSDIQERLEYLSRQYESKLQRCQDLPTPPLVPDRRDAIFYAIQALPYHLSRITVPQEVRESMCNHEGPYVSWSRAYWAMSNIFSRPAQGPLPSPWSTWETSPEHGPSNSVRTLSTTSTKYEEDIDMGKIMESLVAAVKANNQDFAVTLAEHVLNLRKADGQKDSKFDDMEHPHQVTWPISILWRAIWLGMNRLLEILVDSGMPIDDSSAAYTPSPLHLAAALDNSEAVNLLIERGADFRVTGTGGRNPLQSASSRGYKNIVKLLLEKDSSMLEEPHPWRPLYAAACWGSWDTVKVLLENGAQTELKHTPVNDDESEYDIEVDWTPLTAAASEGYSKTARMLLKYGADPNKESPGLHRVPLFFAVLCGSVELVQLLLEHNADPNRSLNPTILTSIIEGARVTNETKMSMIKALLHGKTPVSIEQRDADGRTALMAAANIENMAAIRFLLDNGADIDAVDSKNQTALFWAVLKGKSLAVKALLSHSVKPRMELTNSFGETLLQVALRHDGLLPILVGAGADLTYANGREQPILNSAVVKGDKDAIKYLLALGAEKNVDIHHRDETGWTPILDATGYKQDTEIVRLLMDHGASLSDVSPQGASPLHFAVMDARPDVLRILLEYRNQDDLEIRDNWGDTPLLCVENTNDNRALDCVQLLVRAGADINARNTQGVTFLMKVAPHGQEEEDIYNYLLSRPEVNVKAASTSGLTALHWASSFGSTALVHKLLERGADPNARAFRLRSTPLIAACMPSRVKPDAAYDIDVVQERMAVIVRDLVSHGAAIQAMEGIGLFSPLAAASLCANVATVEYLLDNSAIAMEADPLGRLPIHFAAANGVQNFEALALVHDDSIIVSDRFGKNILHWACQFGHFQTVRAILERLPTKETRDHINAGDVDGWTPLAWACRPTSVDVGNYWVLPEKPDYPATIQYLLDHGADKSIVFQIGKDQVFAEDLTPLEMARRCGYDDDVLTLLGMGATTLNQDGKASDGDANNPLLVGTKKYKQTIATCDFCLSQIWGQLWTCTSCEEGEYVLCKKCYPVGHIEHPKTVKDHREGKEHHFKIYEMHQEEFESPPSKASSAKAPSVVGNDPGAADEQDDAEAPKKEADEESPTGLDDVRFEVDDMGELEFSDLDELDQLDDAV